MGLFSSLINSGLSVAQMNQQKRLQEEQWKREDTAITRQINDARRNGINPLSALGQQGFGSTTDVSGAMMPFDSMKDSITQSASDRSQRWISRESNKVALAKMRTDKEIADANLEQIRIQNNWLRTETSTHNRNVENETSTHNRNVEKETSEHNDVEERIGLDNRDPIRRVSNDVLDTVESGAPINHSSPSEKEFLKTSKSIFKDLHDGKIQETGYLEYPDGRKLNVFKSGGRWRCYENHKEIFSTFTWNTMQAKLKDHIYPKK